MTAEIILGGDPNKLNVAGYSKGDVLAADASGVLQDLTVGSNGEVLTADSVQSVGVGWFPGGAGGAPTVKVWNTGTLSYDTVVGADFYIGGPVNPVVNNGDIWFDTDH
jgi:hypothetical protein